MKKDNSKIGLIVLVIILSVLVIGLSSYLIYDKLINNKEENIVDNKEKNKNIKDDVLAELLPIIGLNNDNKTSKDCDSLSPKFIFEGSKRLDSYSKYQAYTLVTYNYYQNYSKNNFANLEMCLKPGEPAPGGSCYAYSKNILKDIVKKYDFAYSFDEIFAEYIQNEDDDNYYMWNSLTGVCADYEEFKRNISSWYGYATDVDNNVTDDEFITIRDNVSLKYFNGDDSSRIIYYTFKKSDDNNKYKLWLYNIY